ncbi:hypothetical protein DFH07DRAFT_810901 [Mycena maculata]|uniref:F-box domain-containing protein n=1 Tax=Mycena maculata TaxID=230809 RepID=A0AAD7JIG3_9AGAR|nr:hypothetical protein DFH07DRAFT_810901 [Mycena maculata]
MATPIFVLPPELTSVIFGYCLPDGTRPPSPHTAPLLLAQICRQWREICLDTPILWASIQPAIGSVELLKMWLARSKNCPLTFSLKTWDSVRATALMDGMMSHCARWKDVCLVLPPAAYTTLSTYHGPFPALARLELSSRTQPRPKVTVTIRDAPLLRQAYLSNLPTHWQLDLPFEQLIILEFYAIDANAARILQRCTSLVHLSCRLETSDDPMPAVTLHSLRSLTLSGGISEYLVFIVPRLERLSVTIFASNVAATTSGVHALLMRSACGLHSLVVCPGAELSPAELQRFLSVTPSIVSLKFIFSNSVGFREQIQVLGIPGMLPRLNHLEISDNAGRDFGPLLDMLRARRLESFRLLLTIRTLGRPQRPRILPADVLDQFYALAEAGLRLHISTRDGEKPVIILDTLS